MRAVGYCRVSTQEQSKEGVSLDAQQDRIRAWSKANGYELVQIYVDAGISGKRADNRPGLQAALEEVCKESWALVVYSLSRLARSTKDAITIAERLSKSGAALISLTEHLDTKSAAGKMVFRMLAVLSEFERDLVSERTTTALAHKRRQGKRVSRYLPYGWDLAPDRTSLVENLLEQKVICVVRKCREDGWSLRGIARELDQRGVPAKHGGKWSHQTIVSILRREPLD